MRTPIGCPMTQKTSQNIELPINALSNFLSSILVMNIKGACPNIPKKAWKLISLKGTDIITSCNAAEKKKTTKVANVFEAPAFNIG